MKKRRIRTGKQRLAILHANNCTCYLTGMTINPVKDKWHLDHKVPLAGGGSDDDDNLAPVLDWAHLEKTKQDVARIAKGKRVAIKHFGAKVSKRPVPGSRASGWRKRMDGTVERRK